MRLALWLGATIVLTVASIIVLTSDTPNETPSTVTAAGEAVFRAKGCSGCHSAAGVTSLTNTGPDLTDLATRAAGRVEGLDAEGYVRQSVLSPQAFIVSGFETPFSMPMLTVSDAELDAIVAFLLGD
jgi:cytochrome c oxidase subunit 2